VVLLDIPLLFETGGRDLVDAVVVVTAEADVQRQRVMDRPGMTTEKFEALLAKQTPDAEKRRRADYIVDSGHGIEPARAQVREILAKVAKVAPRH
jgi:dephospho-CoA kinase